MRLKFFFILIVCLCLSACAHSPKRPYRPIKQMTISEHQPASQCRYLGKIKNHGNAVKARYTRGHVVSAGVFDGMKQRAKAMGANYIWIHDIQHPKTAVEHHEKFSHEVYVVGKAFSC